MVTWTTRLLIRVKARKGRRFTSYERIDEIPFMVVKKDGTRERFGRQKVIAGVLKACEKRPVSVSALEAVADRIESTLQDRPEKEISTQEFVSLPCIAIFETSVNLWMSSSCYSTGRNRDL